MIRFVTIEDIDALCALEESLFPGDPWNRKQFLYELQENPFAKLVVEEQDGVICGYCDLWITYEQAQIANIAVKQDMQRKGIAQRLMDWMVEYAGKSGCENLTLEVRLSNTPAIALYEKHGFIKASIRKGYYADGESAHLMVKPIGGLYDTVISD